MFYDKPISAKGDALTLYAAYNNNNYGKTILKLFPGPVVDGS
jgi:hypothetical protein